MQPGAYPIRPNGNIAKHVKIRHGDIDIGFSEADIVFKQGHIPLPLLSIATLNQTPALPILMKTEL